MLKRIISGAVLLIVSGFLIGCSLVSDKKLEARFHANEPDFNRLVQMANENSHVILITAKLTSLDNDSSWPRKDLGMSPERWDEYRRLFRKLKIRDGLARLQDPPAVLLVADGSGPVTASSYKGFAYSTRPLLPILSSLDSAKLPESAYDKHGHAIAFKPIGQHWYLYREQY